MSKKTTINDLRDHLFETIECLKDPDKPMDLDRARAISEVASTIIDSAKVEVDLVKAINSRDLDNVRPGSNFFQTAEESEKYRKSLGIAAAKTGS